MAKKIARCMTNCDFDHFDSSIWQPPTRSLLDERSPPKTELRTHPVPWNFLETPVLPLDAATVRGFGPESPTRVRSLMSTDYGGGAPVLRAKAKSAHPSNTIVARAGSEGFQEFFPGLSARSHDRTCLEGSRSGDQVHPILWSDLRRATTERRADPSLCQR